MTPASCDLEQQIIDILADEDGEIHAGEALTTLLYVAAGVCCLASNREPNELAIEFADKLRHLVASEHQQPRMLS